MWVQDRQGLGTFFSSLNIAALGRNLKETIIAEHPHGTATGSQPIRGHREWEHSCAEDTRWWNIMQNKAPVLFSFLISTQFTNQWRCNQNLFTKFASIFWKVSLVGSSEKIERIRELSSTLVVWCPLGPYWSSEDPALYSRVVSLTKRGRLIPSQAIPLHYWVSDKASLSLSCMYDTVIRSSWMEGAMEVRQVLSVHPPLTHILGGCFFIF